MRLAISEPTCAHVSFIPMFDKVFAEIFLDLCKYEFALVVLSLDLFLAVLLVIIGVLAVVMHRANISRLLHGKETKTVLHKKGSRS